VSASFPKPLLEGLAATLQSGIDERIKQLDRLGEKIEASRSCRPSRQSTDSLQEKFISNWPQMNDLLIELQRAEGDHGVCEKFLTEVGRQIQTVGRSYLRVIHSLDRNQAAMGTHWLQSIVTGVESAVGKLLNANINEP
jgi:hypothetical protein